MKLVFLFTLFEVTTVLSTPVYRISENENKNLVIYDKKQQSKTFHSADAIVKDYKNITKEGNDSPKNTLNISDIKEKLLDHLLNYISTIIQKDSKHNVKSSKEMDLQNDINTYNTPSLEIDAIDGSKQTFKTLPTIKINNMDQEILDNAKDLIIPQKVKTILPQIENNYVDERVTYDYVSNEKFNDDIPSHEELSTYTEYFDNSSIPSNIALHDDNEEFDANNFTIALFMEYETTAEDQQLNNTKFDKIIAELSNETLEDSKGDILPKPLSIKSKLDDNLTSTAIIKIDNDLELTSTTIKEIDGVLSTSTEINTATLTTTNYSNSKEYNRVDVNSTISEKLSQTSSLKTSTVIPVLCEQESPTDDQFSTLPLMSSTYYDVSTVNTSCKGKPLKNTSPTFDSLGDLKYMPENKNKRVLYNSQENDDIKLDKTNVNLDKKVSISIKLNQNSTLALFDSLLKKLLDW